MRSLVSICGCLMLLACGAGTTLPPASPATEVGKVGERPLGAPAAEAEPAGLGAEPAGLAPLAAECQSYAEGPPAVCPSGTFDEKLSAALAASGLLRDQQLRCLESAPQPPAGWVRALRADLAPRGCGDLVVGVRAEVSGAGRELADTLLGLGIAARLHRSVRSPPLPEPPFDKAEFIRHFKEVLTPWIKAQAHAVDTLSRFGPRLTGYARGVVALEAGLADMRFVNVARSLELPEELKGDSELREVYLVSLEQALEPRVVRGRDAALVGFGEMSKQGILTDARLADARSLLSELYAGRRLDSLDRLLLPPLPPLETDTPALKVAALLPAFYALKLARSPSVQEPELLRARLEQGVPPALWLSQAPLASSELAELSRRALFRLGQTYFWAEPFAKAAAIEPTAGDASAALMSALSAVLARGPQNAATLMLGPPRLPPELGDVARLDALSRIGGPLAGLAEFDAAYLRSLAPPPNDPAFWREQSARYERARKKLERPADKAAAADLLKAAQETERALSQNPKP